MFEYESNGLLGRLSKEKTKAISAPYNKLLNSEMGRERKNVLIAMQSKKDSENIEKQTEILEKMYKSQGGSRQDSRRGNMPPIVGNIGIGKLLKKFTFVATLVAVANSLNKGLVENLEKEAQAANKSIDELSFSEKARAVTKTLETSIFGIINKALSAVGVDYQIDTSLISKAANKVGNVMSIAVNNFIANTGQFGKDTEKALNSLGSSLSTIDNYIGNKISRVTDGFSEFKDSFLSQTSDHKDFIALTKKMRGLKSNGFVEDEDRGEYSKLEKKALVVANRLKSNESFMGKSGYSNDVTALIDDLLIAREKKREQEAKYSHMTSNLMGNGSIFGVGGYSKKEISTQRAIMEQEQKRYISLKKEKTGAVSQEERATYNAIGKKERAGLSKGIEKKKEIEKQLLLVDKSLALNKAMIDKDTKNKNIYQSNVDNALLEQGKLNKELRLITQSLTAISKTTEEALGEDNLFIGSGDKQFLEQLGQTESRGNYFTGKNKNGYEGKYQFRFRDKGDHGTQLAKKMGVSPKQIRESPKLQEQMMALALKEYDREIENSGLEVNNWNRWLRHNQGAGGMRSINRGTLTKGIRRNIRNQGIKGNTDKELISNYSKKFKHRFTASATPSNSSIKVSKTAKKRKITSMETLSRFKEKVEDGGGETKLNDSKLFEAISKIKAGGTTNNADIIAELVKMNSQLSKQKQGSTTKEVIYHPTKAYKEG